MSLALKRMTGIFLKDTKDGMRNLNVWLMPIIPLGLAVFYRTIMDAESLAFFTPALLLIVFGMSAGVTQSMMIAEEKEKNTLRMLMLTPAKPYEVLIGKAGVATLFTFVATVIALLIFELSPADMLQVIVLSIPMFIIFLLLGTFVGLVSKNVSSASGLGLPIILLLSMFPLLTAGLDFAFIETISQGIAPVVYSELIISMMNEGWSATSAMNWLVLFIWLLATLVITYIAYRKNAYD
ncbi:ABC transporter permease [Shouchella sp. JSM 1781072]|uniref:ABC transporter permease n=1 Tax=Bacillaceae TaxID=186817 RepID=UPI0020D029D9|nr:ABC transporter permease [Alkalihalobacillus sp. LMS6]UTR06297.1 ABC transporter permease [Alkalihalobacillus sp. LMS6]